MNRIVTLRHAVGQIELIEMTSPANGKRYIVMIGPHKFGELLEWHDGSCRFFGHSANEPFTSDYQHLQGFANSLTSER